MLAPVAVITPGAVPAQITLSNVVFARLISGTTVYSTTFEFTEQLTGELSVATIVPAAESVVTERAKVVPATIGVISKIAGLPALIEALTVGSPLTSG